VGSPRAVGAHGRAKAGKTTALIDFGINAWAAGFNVGYVTLEVSAKIIGERMDSNISEHDFKELGDHVHDVRKKVQDFIGKARRARAVKARSS
jgi:replicative DNA helicase